MPNSIAASIVRRLPGHLPSAEVAHVRALLASPGTVVGRTSARALPIVEISDAARGASLLAVDKASQGPQELAALELIDILGLGHLAPTSIAQGADGVRMLKAPGVTAADAGVESAADLLALRERHLVMHLDPDDARRFATVEIESMQALDYLLANSDRHRGNVMVDTAAGDVTFIDHGAVGDGDLFRPRTPETWIKPRLQPAFQGPGGATRLSDDTMSWLGEHLDEQRLRAWHQRNAASVPRLSEEALIERLRHLISERGFSYDYGPTNLWKQPVYYQPR